MALRQPAATGSCLASAMAVVPACPRAGGLASSTGMHVGRIASNHAWHTSWPRRPRTRASGPPARRRAHWPRAWDRAWPPPWPTSPELSTSTSKSCGRPSSPAMDSSPRRSTTSYSPVAASSAAPPPIPPPRSPVRWRCVRCPPCFSAARKKHSHVVGPLSRERVPSGSREGWRHFLLSHLFSFLPGTL
jgi:hypothetical protein